VIKIKHNEARILGKSIMPLSYTQNIEDYHLSLAFMEQQTGFYIDVGAGHPVADNFSLWFYERGWKGVLTPSSDPVVMLV
jgi:hypothetical protein